MTNIDFYILPDTNMAARDHFACRLAEKAVRISRHVVISVEDKQHADSLSDYLWSFKPEAFLPHSFSTTNPPSVQSELKENIIIDWDNQLDNYHDVIINLKRNIPEEFSRFQKLSEVVVQDEALLPITRSHFQFYRDRGYPLKSHQMTNHS